MLQSEYDAIVLHKRLKIFLIILTTIMVVAVVLFVRKQFFVNDIPLPVEEVAQPELISAKEYEFQSDEEMEAFLNSGDPNAEILRSYMGSASDTNPSR